MVSNDVRSFHSYTSGVNIGEGTTYPCEVYPSFIRHELSNIINYKSVSACILYLLNLGKQNNKNVDIKLNKHDAFL
jgi:hypothetical protein